MKKVTIDRSKWVRAWQGKEPGPLGCFGEAAMLNNKGNMCCLGHVCFAYGVSKQAMVSEPLPGDVKHPRVPKFMLSSKKYLRTATIAKELAQLNDNARLSAKQRERAIAKKLKEVDVLVEFVGSSY